MRTVWGHMGVGAVVVAGFLGAARAEDPKVASALALGATIPMADAKLKNIDGREISIDGVKGAKGTLVLFTCNHCPFVVGWEPRITELGNSYSRQGVGVIAINSNDPKAYPADDFESMQKRAKERGFAFAYAVDATSGLARAFGATHTPEAFLFDKDGKLVYHGTIDDNVKAPDEVKNHYLRDALEALVAGRDIAVKETKALGCGIKFRPS